MSCAVTIELGAYILGAVNATDRSRIESHVAGCDICQRELIELSLLPGLLSRVTAGDIPAAQPTEVPVPPIPTDPPTRRHIARTPRRRVPRPTNRRLWIAAAAATVIAAGGTTAGLILGTASTAQAATVLHGTNAATGLQATIRLTPEQWGTQVAMDLKHLPQKAWCQLVVHTRDGKQEVGASWTENSASGEARLPAATSFRLADISSVDIVTNKGKSLINIAKGVQG
jgi:hypothetical protein